MLRALLRPGTTDSMVTIQGGIGAGLRFHTHRASGEYSSGLNELPLQNALAQSLKPGDVFYDIGANIGFFTVIGARLVGERGQVFTFEPVPENALAARQNAERNNFAQVTVIQKAVSTRSGEGQLLLTRHPGGASLHTDAPTPDATGLTTVTLVSIDDFIFQEGNPPPAVVKIDVEGAELDVLQGMTKTLTAVRPLVFYEIDDQAPEQLTQKAERCASFLRDFDYAVSRLPDSYANVGWNIGHFSAVPR